MMLSAIKIILFLFILILPFRGPRKRRESPTDRAGGYSEYVVTETGNLDFVKKEAENS